MRPSFPHQPCPEILGPAPLDAAGVVAARPLLDKFPYPVLWVGPTHDVKWMNRAACAAYGDKSRKCYELSHGFPVPCPQRGEPCPKEQAEATGRVCTKTHAHEFGGSTHFFLVTAVPIDGKGVVMFHVSLDDGFALDALTAVWSRPFFEQLVRRQLSLAQRLDVACSIVMADVDKLKPINDRHGHAVGDTALRAVSEVLRATVREADVVGRIGGDEFCIFLPTAEKDEALMVARRIRSAVQRIRLPDVSGNLKLTLSMGVHAAHGPCDLERAMAAADRALYRAKSSGPGGIATVVPRCAGT